MTENAFAALEPGRSSWTALLDAVRLGPEDDETAVTAAQVREVVTRLIEAQHWREGDPPILVIFDAGYDVTRLAFLLADLPAELLGRLRSDGCCTSPPRCASLARTGGHPGTAPSSSPQSRAPGQARRSPLSPRPSGTGRRRPSRGTGCIPG
ncbi:MAG: transposase [Streptosporangiaceae bacterium]